MTSLRKRRVEEAVAKVWKRLSKFSEALAFPGFSNPLFSSFIYVHLLISSHFHWPDRALDACNTHSDLTTVCNEHLAQKGGVLDLHHSLCPRQPILFNYDILMLTRLDMLLHATTLYILYMDSIDIDSVSNKAQKQSKTHCI